MHIALWGILRNSVGDTPPRLHEQHFSFCSYPMLSNAASIGNNLLSADSLCIQDLFLCKTGKLTTQEYMTNVNRCDLHENRTLNWFFYASFMENVVLSLPCLHPITLWCFIFFHRSTLWILNLELYSKSILPACLTCFCYKKTTGGNQVMLSQTTFIFFSKSQETNEEEDKR